MKTIPMEWIVGKGDGGIYPEEGANRPSLTSFYNETARGAHRLLPCERSTDGSYYQV